MDSKEDQSQNPWARFLGIDNIEYSEITEAPVKPRSTVTKLNYEDMSLFGLCPEEEDLYLTICKICESILLPQALKAHMELRHGAKVKKKPDEKLSSESLSTKSKTIPPAPIPSSSAACSISLSAATSVSSECSNAYSACSSSSVRIPDSFAVDSSTFMALTQPCTEAKPSWSFGMNSVHGATLSQSFLNTNASANIVRVKPENSKLKLLNMPYSKVDSRVTSLIKNLPTKKTVSHKKELSSSQQPRLIYPDMSSNFTSLPNASSTFSRMPLSKSNVVVKTEIKTEPISVYSPVPQPSQISSPSSSESSSTTDNSESSQPTRKTPALEKLVLRRVLQTGPNSSAVRRPTFQKGMKGLSRNKKDTQETFFMVVKQKDRQQNLLAARQQLRKQSNVVHKEKETSIDYCSRGPLLPNFALKMPEINCNML